MNKSFTQRQLVRRADILNAARQLIAERGYEGVNMRDLSRQSGVALKTLYHQFGSKDELLFVAVEEMFRAIYESIDEANIDKGIDRFSFIIDKVVESMVDNETYARALFPFLTSQPRSSTFDLIRTQTYRKAIDQISAENDFVPWVDIDLLCSTIFRLMGGTYAAWQRNELSLLVWADVEKLDICLCLASVTRGYTQEVTTATAKSLQQKLRNKDEPKTNQE